METNQSNATDPKAADKQPEKKLLKEFGLTTFAVDNATSVFVLVFIIVIMGWGSYRGMPKELYPEIVIPTIYVGTPYPGTSAADMENLVTRPIEQEIKSVTGVKEIKSTSIQDYSTIIVEFDTDVDVEVALQDVKDAVDRSKSELPNDLPADPNVFDINFSEFPVVTVNLSGDYTVDELRGYAEDLQDKIEGLTEVSEVEIKGALEREVKIDLDLAKMQGVGLGFDDVAGAIGAENVTMSGGEVVSNGFRRAMRVVGEFETVEEIANIIVKSEDGRAIYLRDVADVRFDFEEASSFARSDRLPVVSLDIIKRSGANLLDCVDKSKAIVAEAQLDGLPKDLKVSLFNDTSVDIRRQLSDLENNIISGVILVVLILLFFLGTRSAMFVGIAIPLSMLMGFAILDMMDYELNMMVLFSLILALGMLVDNGIVVVENIYRYMQEGYSAQDAAKKGTGEVAVPIITSTLTTLAAFLPLLFWQSLMGNFMKYLPITLIIVLSSSLFVALVVNPVLAKYMMSVDTRDAEPGKLKRRRRNVLIFSGIFTLAGFLAYFAGNNVTGNLMFLGAILSMLDFFVMRPVSYFFQDHILTALENGYEWFLKSSLKGVMPVVVFGGTFGLLFLSLVLLGIRPPKVVYFPSTLPTYINVFVELPLGTDIEVTNNLTRELEEKVTKTVEPYKQAVESILTQVGEGTSDPNSPEQESGKTPHKARITVAFVPTEERGGVNTVEVLEKIRENIQGYAGALITVDKNQDGPPTGKPINIELVGKDQDRLVLLASEMTQYLNESGIGGIEELRTDVTLGKPELLIDVDREAARRYGLSTYAIGSAIRTAVFGYEASQFRVGEDEYPIQIRLDEKYRYNVDALMNQKVVLNGNGGSKQIPISAVARVRFSSTYSSIKRKDLDRAVTVYSNVTQDYNANEVVAEVKDAMLDFEMPEGYTYRFTGEQEEQSADMAFLGTAFMFALFFIFLILVAQFNSVTTPFIIMFSVLFSTIGVFLGYFISNMDFVVIMTGIGIVSLAGVVVNNAIVLLDFIKLETARGCEDAGIALNEATPEIVRHAIVEAGKTRLRPVLLTAITTILGLIPLAVGFNINFATLISELDPKIFIGGDNVAFWGPMSWTIIYGLTFSTFLTLVVVPVMHWLVYASQRGIVRLFRPKPAAVALES